MAAENLLEHFQNGPDNRISLPELKLAFAAAAAAAVCESIHSCETWNWRKTEKVLQLLILQNLALWNFTVNFICGSSAVAVLATAAAVIGGQMVRHVLLAVKLYCFQIAFDIIGPILSPD